MTDESGAIGMIKGVNRQIIEVTDTGNEYFERAWLVVRPPFSDASTGRLHDEAQRFVRQAGGYSSLKMNRRQYMKNMLIQAGIFGGLGVLVGAVMMTVVR